MTDSSTTWPTEPLGTVAKIERRSVTPEKIRDGSIYVGLENITGEGGFDNVREVANGELASNKFEFTRTHVLYGKLRPYLSKIARPDFDGICSTDILPILPGKSVNRDFLYYFLRQPEMVQHATTRSTGANLPRLSPTQLAEFPVPLPHLEEQKRIAAILGKADAIRRKRTQLIFETRNLAISAIEHELTRLRTRGLTTSPIESVCVKVTDGTHLTPRFQRDGIPFIFVKNIVDEQINFETSKYIDEVTFQKLTKSTKIERDDVLYTTVGATYGQAALVERDEPFAFQRHLAHLKPNTTKVLPAFLAAVMNLPRTKWQADRWARGAAQPTINLTELRQMVVPHPSLEAQRTIVEVKQKCDALIATLQRATMEDNDLFNSLVQRAFKGEL